MREGKCSRCGSLTVFAKQNGLQLGEDINGVRVYTSWATGTSPTVVFVCVTCGYFEHYLIDRNKLDEVARTWEQVVPSEIKNT
jgi:hypothetical protein